MSRSVHRFVSVYISAYLFICVYLFIWLYLWIMSTGSQINPGSTQDQPICVHTCAYVVNIISYPWVSDLYQCIYAYICTYQCISVCIQTLVSISVHMCVSVYIMNICQYLSISVQVQSPGPISPEPISWSNLWVQSQMFISVHMC